MKFLVAGLGNIGDEYYNTRHNIGFRILDAFAEASDIKFKDKRYGFIALYEYSNRLFTLLKPTTFVNRSGRAVNYWLNKAGVPVENLLVIVDDIALPLGTLRIRTKGGDGGHNGLQSISQILGHQNYARLRFGIGSNYEYGTQVDYVLGEWEDEEEKVLEEKFSICRDIILSFGTTGIEKTMNEFNNK